MTPARGSSRLPAPIEARLRDLRALLDAAAQGRVPEPARVQEALHRLEDALGLLARVSASTFRQFEHRVRDLSLLQRVGELFASCFDLDQLADALLELLTSEFQAGWAALYLVEASAPAPQLAGERGRRADDVLRALGREAAAQVVRHRRELCVGEVRQHPLLRALADAETPRSLLCVPLQGAQDCLGAILLAAEGAHAFGMEQLRTLRPVAALASVAVRHARLYRSLVDRQNDLESLVRTRTRALDEARTALSRQEKMAALGKLAASIAHEINNPMSYVLSNVSAARDYVEEIARTLGAESEAPGVASRLEELSELLTEVSEGLLRIRSVAYELKGFGRSELDAATAADLNQIVETALQIAEAEAKPEVRIERRLDAVPLVLCHRYQIVQVVLNLVMNAMEALEDGGTIRVTTRAHTGRAYVEVADDGPGIPTELAERIFEPFFSTKGGGNSGLGLAISRDIAVAHGGRLDVRGGPGGTTFTLSLPVEGSSRLAPKGPPAPGGDPGPS